MTRRICAHPLAAFLLFFATAAWSGHGATAGDDPVTAASGAMRAQDFLDTVTTLSSDDFEGRSVGTHGGQKTEDWIVAQFRRIGLAPGGSDGSYLQAVPLMGHRSVPLASVHIGTQRIGLRSPEDYVAWSFERKSRVDLKDSELVFVGYGVVAPEYGWDDFKGADLRGKTLVVLINDPQIPDPQDPSRLDPSMFKGKAMTYYGRWTYKYEKAVELGAAAVLIVHETRTAAYPWSVVVNSNSKENFDLDLGGPDTHFPPVSGWITTDKAREVFRAAGKDFDALKQSALRRDFRPVALGARLDVMVDKMTRNLAAHNIIGRIEGSDPKLREEVVIYSAHWDHLGWDPGIPGTKHDQVFHGAVDNASGVASILELAKAFKALPVPPRRSILFIAVAAEERGLLGAQYYATHPVVPLARTLADINIDGMNMWGPTRGIEVVGYGSSDLEDILAREAAAQGGRQVIPDLFPEHGGYFRADHFEFAKAGVPALYTKGGGEYIGKPADYGPKVVEDFVSNRYHKPADVVLPGWDLSGTLQDLDLLFRTGLDVAQGERYPQWRDTSEFKAARERMMAGVGR